MSQYLNIKVKKNKLKKTLTKIIGLKKAKNV